MIKKTLLPALTSLKITLVNWQYNWCLWASQTMSFVVSTVDPLKDCWFLIGRCHFIIYYVMKNCGDYFLKCSGISVLGISFKITYYINIKTRSAFSIPFNLEGCMLLEQKRYSRYDTMKLSRLDLYHTASTRSLGRHLALEHKHHLVRQPAKRRVVCTYFLLDIPGEGLMIVRPTGR